MSTFHTYRFSFHQVAPSEGDVLDFLQSSDLDKEHPAVVFTHQILHEISSNDITGGYILKDNEPVDVKQGEIRVEDTILKVGSQIASYLKEATRTAFFLCTAGEYFTKKTTELNDSGDIMEAFILDAVGSLTVENAMNQIQESLSEALKPENLKISNRYSPGYCNWHLSDQKHLFDLIGQNPTGVNINSSCLMTPRKSVSGVIGIGEHVKRREYGCKICRNVDCIYRKIIKQ